MLIGIYPDGAVTQAENPSSASQHYTGIQKVLIATLDASLEADVYANVLGLAADSPQSDAGRGVLTCVVHPPKGGVIELISPIDSSQETAHELQSFLNENGEGIYALELDADGDAPQHDFRIFGTRFLISK